MTTEITAPDLSDYRVIHRCLRTAPHRVAAALTAFEAGDRDHARALARYWAGYAGEVLAHHTVEDEIFFPRLVERVPVAAHHLQRVDGDHHRLDVLMAAAGTAFERLGTSARVADADDAGAVVRELASHMDSHLDFEDEDLVPLFGRHFTAEEYKALSEAAMKHPGLGKQAAFTVPFVMHSASAPERTKLLGEAPLPFRILFRITRGGHARLTQAALGSAAVAEEVLV